MADTCYICGKEKVLRVRESWKNVHGLWIKPGQPIPPFPPEALVCLQCDDKEVKKARETECAQ